MSTLTAGALVVTGDAKIFGRLTVGGTMNAGNATLPISPFTSSGTISASCLSCTADMLVSGTTNSIVLNSIDLGPRGVFGTCGGSDIWFVGNGSTTDNNGYLELSTGTDGATPIYARQYGTAYSWPPDGAITRTLTLLDPNGNTYIPGGLTTVGTITPSSYFQSTAIYACLSGASLSTSNATITTWTGFTVSPNNTPLTFDTSTGKITNNSGSARIVQINHLSYWSTTNTTGARLSWMLQNSDRSRETSNDSPNPTTQQLSVTIQMNNGDFIQFQYWQNSGSTVSIDTIRTTITCI